MQRFGTTTELLSEPSRFAQSLIAPTNRVRVLTNSTGLSWRGLQLEVAATEQQWRLDRFSSEHHFLGLNLNDEPLRLNMENTVQGHDAVIPPNTFYIAPAGYPVSFFVDKPAYCAGFLVDEQFLDAAAGRHREIGAICGLEDNVLFDLALVLIDFSKSKKCSDEQQQRLSKSLIHSFVLSLGLRHGQPLSKRARRGGIAPHHLRRLREWIDEHLEYPITVQTMAGELGLSTAHFSRAFKESTGGTPWNFVLSVRLERARKLLSSTASIDSIASQCGFADSAHLSRLFKRQYGRCPSRMRSSSNDTCQCLPDSLTN